MEYKCESPFEGSVEIEIPKYTQRLKYIRDCNFVTGTDGEISAGMDNVDSIISMIESARPHVKNVKVKNVETGDEASSFEELEDNPAFDALLPVLAPLVLNGGKVGNA